MGFPESTMWRRGRTRISSVAGRRWSDIPWSEVPEDGQKNLEATIQRDVEAGINHIGIGSDYDGITSVPEGLEDVSKYPVLTAELLRREYSEEDILKILGGNILRLMRAVENAATRIQQERGPSEASIEDLDG